MLNDLAPAAGLPSVGSVANAQPDPAPDPLGQDDALAGDATPRRTRCPS